MVYGEYTVCSGAIMENFRKYFKQEKWRKELVISFLLLLIPFISDAGSIREVRQSIERVQSVKPPFQFALIGDSRDGEKTFTRLMEKVLERRPHFIIHLGDMITRPGKKEWKGFFRVSKLIDLPFFPVAGNHDVGDTLQGEEMYRKQFDLPEEKTCYSFRAGGILFVILDSEKGKRKILEEQWKWLEQTLSSSGERFKLVFLHRPLFPPADSLKLGKAMDKYPSARDNLHALFKRTKVRAVFAGDDHRYHWEERDQIVYVITGGGGAPIYASKDRGGYFHYVFISVKKERLEGEVIDLEGQVRDKFMIE
jgi:predicted phosphodiesterase